MTTYNLKFFLFKDKKPPNETDIFYVLASRFYGTYEIRYGRAVYDYEEIDEDGHPTGTTYFDVPDDIPEADKERLNLCVVVDGEVLDDDTLWCPAKAVDLLLDKVEGK